MSVEYRNRARLIEERDRYDRLLTEHYWRCSPLGIIEGKGDAKRASEGRRRDGKRESRSGHGDNHPRGSIHRPSQEVQRKANAEDPPPMGPKRPASAQGEIDVDFGHSSDETTTEEEEDGLADMTTPAEEDSSSSDYGEGLPVVDPLSAMLMMKEEEDQRERDKDLEYQRERARRRLGKPEIQHEKFHEKAQEERKREKDPSLQRKEGLSLPSPAVKKGEKGVDRGAKKTDTASAGSRWTDFYSVRLCCCCHRR